MNVVRPGPERIPPGYFPGGVVIHVYAVPSGVLLTETMAKAPAQAAYEAGSAHEAAQAVAPEGNVGYCLVAFDGDSGDRFPPEAWYP